MKVKIRKATMTNKERIEALLRREKPDRVPFQPGGRSFAVLYSGGSIPKLFSGAYTSDWVYQAEKKASREFDWVFTPAAVLPGGRGGYNGTFGGEIKLPTSQYSQAVFVVRYPATTPEEVMALKVPDVRAQYTPEVVDFYKRVRQDEDDNKPFHMSVGAVSVINMAGGIAGAEKLCKWMLQKPEIAHRVLRLAADYQIATAQFCKDTFGVERAIVTGANAFASNQLISPKHFEQFCLPYLKEVHQKVLAMGFKHISTHPCGEQNLNLPYWQQIPLGDPGIFRVGNEIDLETAARYFPNDIIGGNLDTTIIQEGTPEEVYQAARKVIEQGKSLANGFSLSPACELPPLAPVENMRAITRALNDFGWYD
ncbi:MAG: hypothetical protein HY528_04630 [Chloroflexi bacterium]|nr:hypothetical protein [Chloroflexota bacterium]